MNHQLNFERRLFSSLGVLVVIYCMVVLGFVTTSPDLGIRCLLIGDVEESLSGIEIQGTSNLEYKGPAPPERGDVLLKIGGTDIHSFFDFTRTLSSLRNAPIPPGGRLSPGEDPSEKKSAYSLPPLVEIESEGRFVEVQFWRSESQSYSTTWLRAHSLPMSELALTFIWFVLELGIFALAALAYWNRPFDQTARLFFLMCIFTLGAFVGGYHWWVIAGTLWLNIPFVICAILVPAVTCHFFLTFLRRTRRPTLNRGLTLAGLYFVPSVAMLGIISSIIYLRSFQAEDSNILHIDHVTIVANILHHEIYAYLLVASLYFAVTLAILISGYFRVRNPIEKNQVKWMLWAGGCSAIPVSYALYLAQFDQVSFALGKASFPMFLASLMFMMAYTVGIVRYNLMLLDQIVNRGMLFYVTTTGVTLAFGVVITLGSLVAGHWNISPTPQQALSVFATLLLSVMLLLWFRDQLQHTIDRKFFRQKYQLDKALQRMNRAVGNVVDQHSLSERMLVSCRDVLRVKRAALYIRDANRPSFQLVASTDTKDIPLQFSADKELLQSLMQDSTFQRVTPAGRSDLSPVQHLLQSLQAELIHVLESDEEVSGLVVLGERGNGAPFTAEDVTFLNALGQITGVALQCAKVHQDLTRLNEDLEHKVEKISDQKRQIAFLQTELNNVQSVPEVETKTVFHRGEIKGNSPAIRDVLETVQKVAASQSSVLIRGESGTGKELLAKAIHENSSRHSGPIVQVHCAALSPTLLESELFGHVEGAFTGANQNRQGRFELAHGGTLFLDEIGDISMETQIKLLRVLQERSFVPVGGERSIEVDVRLITATHQNLEKLITEGKFREDLYYRLNVISITLPPLRERRDDIFELALHFLKKTASRTGKRISRIDDEALEALENYSWPGNIRELENVIERSVVLTDDEFVSRRDLSEEVREAKSLSSTNTHKPFRPTTRLLEQKILSVPEDFQQPVDDLKSRLRSLNKEDLKAALENSGGNKAEAARLLGIPRSTFYSRLKKYSID